MAQQAIPLAEDTGAGAALRRALVLGTCTAVTFLYAMTVTIANVSLPQMQGALSATQDQIAWVVTANLVATAIATPLAGWLVSRFGRRWVCNACVIAFGVVSLGCGLAESLEQLVLFRALQGAFGAPLAPVSQAIVLDTYPRRQHGAVIAIFGIGSVLGPIVGPVVGGYLSETYSWRWVFYMIVPFAAAALAGTWLFIRDRESPVRVRLDWLGFLVLSAMLASLQLMLDRGERADWFESGEIVAYGAIAVLALYAFVVHSLTAQRPFLQPALFRDRNFTIGLVLIFVFGMLNFTPMTLIPPLLQGVSGYPDSVIGFVLGARGMGTVVGFFLMIFASRFDPRAMIAAGLLFQALAGWQLTQLDMNPSAAGVFWPMVLQGFGVGVLWVPITMVTFSTLGPASVSEGSAIYHMVRNVGSSIHISLSIAIAVRMTRANYAELAPAVSPYNEALGMPWVTGAWNVHDAAGLAALGREVARQSAMIGYIDAFVFFIATALVVLPLVLLVRWKR
ncbi:MAG TPA: DHA2 family efflux MFS transporter permease subunit [Burkholderiales bacterium]|nr:DHA2 family efflux MFS transporter permease subunit [Burkholderiales bacterium]